MIVYRDYREQVKTSEILKRIVSIYEKLNSNTFKYQDAVGLLIETGEFETGITDVFSSESDNSTPPIAFCRKLTSVSAGIVCRMWDNLPITSDQISSVGVIIRSIRNYRLPEKISLSVPEGFAYYGLYPETYLEAAENFFCKTKPQSVVCIGLRSIGTQLSAIVKAKLEQFGCTVFSFTVRPKGHPFHRFVELSDELKNEICRAAKSVFAIVDEGPGLSGSSITGTIAKLLELGIGRDRIVLFPSWIPDGRMFVSKYARSEWPLYEKYTGDFEKLWIQSGRLEKKFNKNVLVDISAGNWRYEFVKDQKNFPAVHPHHERRKYLVVSGDKKEKSILKFSGLGRYGEKMFRRAQVLFESGMTPEPLLLRDGFMEMKFVNGTMMTKNGLDGAFINKVSGYLTFIKKRCKGTLTVSFDKMREMIESNVLTGLGDSWGKRLFNSCEQAEKYYGDDPVEVDGRMMPHDWLKTCGGYVKTDHVEHYADQFFHGCQDIAWDIAGFFTEFDLSKSNRTSLLEQFIKSSGDKTISLRMPFFTIAYLSFRLGYVTMAADSLDESMDKKRFRELQRFYSEKLKNEIDGRVL